MDNDLKNLAIGKILLMKSHGLPVACLTYSEEVQCDVLIAGFITALRMYTENLGEELQGIIMRNSIYHLFQDDDLICLVELKNLIDKSIARNIADRIFEAYRLLRPREKEVNDNDLKQAIDSIVTESLLESASSVEEYKFIESKKTSLFDKLKHIQDYIKTIA